MSARPSVAASAVRSCSCSAAAFLPKTDGSTAWPCCRSIRTLTEALKQKDMLFRELYHRVKNNLQLITSFVGLQANKVADPDAKESFRSCLNRIRSISVVHELLYHTDSLDAIDFGAYLTVLCRRLTEALGQTDCITVTVEADHAPVDVETLILLALTVNEVFANALKHAFPDGRHGAIAVTWRTREARCELTVADDGIGMAEPADRGASLGLHLVTILVRQIGAALERRSGHGGTAFVIRVPRHDP